MKAVFDITIDFLKSQGSYVFDRNSNSRFLDLFSMFSSLPLGYNHPIFDESFDQKIRAISHLRMSNNLFHSKELLDFEKRFKKTTKATCDNFNDILYNSIGRCSIMV